MIRVKEAIGIDKLFNTVDKVDKELNELIAVEIETLRKIFMDELSAQVKQAHHTSPENQEKWQRIGKDFFNEYATNVRINIVHQIDETLSRGNGQKRSVNVPELIDNVDYLCENSMYMVKRAMEAFILKLNKKPQPDVCDKKLINSLKERQFKDISLYEIAAVVEFIEKLKDKMALHYFSEEIAVREVTTVHTLYDAATEQLKAAEPVEGSLKPFWDKFELELKKRRASDEHVKEAHSYQPAYIQPVPSTQTA